MKIKYGSLFFCFILSLFSSANLNAMEEKITVDWDNIPCNEIKFITKDLSAADIVRLKATNRHARECLQEKALISPIVHFEGEVAQLRQQINKALAGGSLQNKPIRIKVISRDLPFDVNSLINSPEDITPDDIYQFIDYIAQNELLAKNIVALDLSGTLVSELPESIDRLISLQSLNLSNTLALSEVPISMSRLTNLESLDLSYKSLLELPEFITHLINLRTLNLEINELSTVPESIGRLEKLQILKLGGNKLITIPESITHLKHLKNLDLRSNFIPPKEQEKIKNMFKPGIVKF